MSNTYNILVDLDALLDTRLATAIELAPDVCNELMVTNEDGLSWWTRPHDHFDDPKSPIQIPGYKAAWESRTEEILPKSLVTNLMYFIREQTLEVLDGQYGKASLDLVDYAHSHIDINIYPYELPDKVQDRIAEMVKRQCAMGTTAKCVRFPHKVLNPDYLESGYKIYFLYEFSSWVHNFEAQMLQSQLPTDNLYFVPSLLHDNTLDTIEDLDDDIEDFRFDKQMALKLALSRFINYEPLPVMLFSIYNASYAEQFRHEMMGLRKEMRERRMSDHGAR